jgi:rRNA pseudouridine-1189 N-methylase Emg1 (Nep1/Mra1 family)
LTASKHIPSVLLPKAAKILKVQKKAPLIEKLEPYIKQATENDKPLVFVIPVYDCDVEPKVPICGALGGDREEEEVSLSHYDLSSVNTCSRVCFAFEELWGVL